MGGAKKRSMAQMEKTQDQPYSLASQFNVKLSVAKDLLEELERRKLVTLVGGNARIRIYQPAAA